MSDEPDLQHDTTTTTAADLPTTMRAVRFDEYGDRSVLHVAEVDVPTPDADRVLVQVKAAGTNPGESAIRQGAFDEDGSATFPIGQGTDLAGVVAAIGADVTTFSVGDEVVGWSWERSSQAEYVAVPVGQLIQKPRRLSWEVAGGLDVVATTAASAVRALDPKPGETIVVSAAAGGVGSFLTQLLTIKGVDVIAIASESNHEWLSSLGARPVAYGDGLADRIRDLATNGIDALADTFGDEYVHLGITLGIPADRIVTVIGFGAAQEVGAKVAMSTETADPAVLSEMANLVAEGEVEVPIAATYPLEQVQEAYEQLEQRHTRGKIVLIP